MASVVQPSQPAPFLKFSSDSAPSWTENDKHHQSDVLDQHKVHISDPRCSSPDSTRYSERSQQERGSTSLSEWEHEPIDSEQQHTLTHEEEKKSALQASSLNDHDHFIAPDPLATETLPHFKNLEDEIIADFQGKKIYLFVDYDGTLTPIVSDPCSAVLSNHMRGLLLDLAGLDRVTVGIVTGRALASVKRFVQISATEHLNFLYAASHGFHIEAAGKQLHHRVGARYIPILREAALKIACALGDVPGVTLEDNEFAVTVHYRNAPPDCASEIERRIDIVLSCYPSLKKTKGKMVFELRINLSWDKGSAVLWLLEAMNVNLSDSNTRLVYIGDDLTDEDAFRVVRQYRNGIAVLVTDTPETRPTTASLFVKDTNEVAEFLSIITQSCSPPSS